ncbi:tripartite tricarboxylate transporter TctB family protein [Desulfosporosinus youngiae]
MHMRDQDITMGIGLVLLSVMGVGFSIQLPNDDFGLSPGFYPTFLFACLGVCGLILVWQGWRRSEKVPLPSFLNKRLLTIIVLLFSYIFLLQLIHFRAATFLFVLFTMYFLGTRKPVLLILVPASSTFIIYWLFVYVFKTAIV